MSHSLLAPIAGRRAAKLSPHPAVFSLFAAKRFRWRRLFREACTRYKEGYVKDSKGVSRYRVWLRAEHTVKLVRQTDTCTQTIQDGELSPRLSISTLICTNQQCIDQRADRPRFGAWTYVFGCSSQP